MKKSIALGLLAVFPLFAHARVFIDGIYYDLSFSTKEAKVSEYYPSYDTPAEHVAIPSSIIYDDTEFTVSSIGERAFSNCYSLSSIDIPQGVKSINDNAFSYCASLSSVSLPDGLISIGENAFEACSSLTGIDLPSSLTSIGYGAFSECSSLKTIHIPGSVKSIGDYAFIRCSSLTGIDLPSSITTIGQGAFCQCTALVNISIPKGLTSLGEYFFSGCSSLTSVAVPNSVTTIGNEAFSGCSSLTSIDLPDGLTSIGYNAFSDCGSLAQIDIPNSVISVGLSAFEGTPWFANFPDGLVYIGKVAYKYKGIMPEGTEIVIKQGIFTIADYAFDGCQGLTSIDVPNSVTCVGYFNFEGTSWYEGLPDGMVYVGKVAYKYKGTMPDGSRIVLKEGTTGIASAAFYNCSSLTSIDIPGSVTHIGLGAFAGCSSLSRIDLPQGVTSIDQSTFTDCTSLTSIDLPAGVTSIGQNAFNGCNSLTDINLPDGVTTIDGWAFSKCSSLTSIDIPQSVISLGQSAFSYCSSLTSVSLPKTMKSIGDYAFYRCSSLTSIHIPDDVTIGSSVFSSCTGLKRVTIGNGVKKLSEYVFYGCDNIEIVTFHCPYVGTWFQYKESIKKIVLGDEVTEVGYEAFQSCTGLVSVICGEGLSYIGSSAFSFCSSLTSIGLADDVISIGMISIGESAFSCCNSLSSIYFSGAVISIGDFAFYECSSLTGIFLADGLTSIGNEAFSNCSSLTGIDLPNGLTSIGEYAFSYCESLTSIEIPSSVTKIGDGAFSNCLSLTDINLPDGVTVICNSVFYDCISLSSIGLPNGLTSIGEYAFSYCESLTSIDIPSSVTTIGAYAFNECSKIKNINLSNGLLSIGCSAFSGCTSLSSIDVPNSVISIGHSAFESTPWYSSLPEGLVYLGRVAYKYKGSMPEGTEIAIKQGTASISNYAFAYCYGLVSINIPDDLVSIGEAAFYLCRSLTGINIPDSVSFIGGSAFSNCTSLISIRLPSSVSKINSSLFFGCTSLTFIEIPNDLTAIGYGAFKGCTSLTSINFPSSVTEIGDDAFSGCGSLSSVHSEIKDVFDISDNVFNWETYENAILYVPTDAVDLYRQAEGWSNFLNINKFTDKMQLTEDLFTIHLPNEDITYDGLCHGATIETTFGVGKTTFYYLKQGETVANTEPPSEVGSYTVYLEIEDGQLYYGRDRWMVGSFTIYQFSSEEWTTLQTIYSQLNGIEWSCPWDLAAGIECVSSLQGLRIEKGHITGLDLSGQNLTGEFPAAILGLPLLRTADLSNNHLKGDIGALSQQYIEQGSFDQTSLEELNISGNQLSGNIGLFARPLYNLTSLFASINCLEDVSPMISKSVTKLELGKQAISRVVPLHMDNIPIDSLSAFLPTILLYDHNSQSYSNDINLRCSALDDIWSMTMVFQNGKMTFSDLSLENSYYGLSGDTLNVAVVNKYGASNGSTFRFKFSFDDGDGNFDGKVNVLDLQSLLNFMFDRYSSYLPYNYTATNLWEDDVINVQDAVCLVNVLLDMDSTSRLISSPARYVKSFIPEYDATISIEEDHLVINSSVPVSAFDIVISTEQQCEVTASLAQMGFTCTTQTNEDRFHLVGYSLGGTTLPVGRNVICDLAEGMIVYAMLADENAQEIKVAPEGGISVIRTARSIDWPTEVYRIPVGSDRVIVINSNREKSMIKDDK